MERALAKCQECGNLLQSHGELFVLFVLLLLRITGYFLGQMKGWRASAKNWRPGKEKTYGFITPIDKAVLLMMIGPGSHVDRSRTVLSCST